MTNLISTIPDVQHMRRAHGPKSNPFSDEKIPGYYMEGIDHTTPTEEATRILLDKLGDELQFGNPEQHTGLIETAYGIARGIGDRFIAQVSPSAFELISFSRSNGESFGMIFGDLSSRRGVSAIGEVHTRALNEGRADLPTFNVNMGEMFEGSKNHRVVTDNLRTFGAEVSSSDVSTLMLLNVIAHESGHIIQRGIGKLIRPGEQATGSASYDVMSRELLRLQPELAQTLHEHTSVRVHNERFAEGYARIVLHEAASALGYEPDTIDKISRALSAGNLDQTMQQHLAAVTQEKGYVEVASENGLEDAYAGDLGYALPLSREQVVLDLEYIHAVRFAGSVDDGLRNKLVAAYTSQPNLETSTEQMLPIASKRKKLGRRIIRAARRILPWAANKAA